MGVSELRRWFVFRKAPGGKKRVLIVRLDGIGDFFIWLPELMKLRDHYADAEVTLLANKLWSEAAEKLLPGIQVIEFSPKLFLNNYKYKVDILSRLRQKGFDTVIQPRFSREFLVEDIITRWCDAPYSVAFRSDQRSINPRLMKWSDRWYTKLLELPEKIKNEHLTNNFFRDKIVGVASGDDFSPAKFLELPDLPETWIGSPYFLIVPGAADPGRRWPPEKLAGVTEFITKHLSLRGIICGSAEDQKAASIILQKNGNNNLLDLTGQTSIMQLVALIRNSRLVVGNDTGAMHIAASCGIKAFCVLGGGQWGRFLPYPDTVEIAPECIYQTMDCYNCNWQCIFERESNSPYPCVNSITVDELNNKIETVMSSTKS